MHHAAIKNPFLLISGIASVKVAYIYVYLSVETAEFLKQVTHHILSQPNSCALFFIIFSVNIIL